MVPTKKCVPTNGSYVPTNGSYTKAPACLVEICFVDSEEDAMLYRKLGAERIAAAICEAITGKMPDYNKEDNEMIYNYIDENMPEWARKTVQKLVDKGVLQGGEDGLNLTEEMLRIFVIHDRLGFYD